MVTDLLRYHNLESSFVCKMPFHGYLCGCHLLASHIRGAENVTPQHAKKVMSDSPGLVDFAIGLVIFVLNLPDRQVLFLWEFKLQKDCNQSC